jgi:hypothetical protein
LGLCLLASATGCALLSVKKPEAQQIRLDVVTTPGALDPCTLSRWLLADELSADQAGELALAARAEGEECAKRHQALIDDVKRHNEGKR